MAAETIKEFLVGLGFKVDEAGLSRFAAAIAGASAGVMAFAGVVNTAAVAAAAAVKKVADDYVEVGKLADAYRTSADAVDSFMSAARAVGADADAAKGVLQGLNDAMGGLTDSSSEAAAVFAGMGIAVQDASGEMRSATDVMSELMLKLEGMDEKSKAATLDILNIDKEQFDALGDGFASVVADVHEMNRAIGISVDDAVKRSKEFSAAWKEAGAEITKWRMMLTKSVQAIALRVMPMLREQLRKTVAAFAEMRKRVLELIKRVIDGIEPIIDVVMRVVRTVTRLAVTIARAVLGIIGWIVRVNDATGGWLAIMGAVALAWKYLNLAFLATPIGMLLAAGLAIAALVDDFLVWKEGGKSLIDWGGQLGNIMQFLIDVVLALGELVIEVINTWHKWLSDFFEWLFPELGQMKDDWDATVAAIVGFGQDLIDAWERVKTWFAEFFDLMGAGFRRVTDAAGNIVGKVSGAWGRVKGFFGNNTPSPSTQAALAGYGAQVSSQTTINVSGTGSPQAVADRVARAQGSAANAMARNLRGAAS